MKFEDLFLEAASDRQKEYMKNYQAKKKAQKRAEQAAEFEDEVRNDVFMTMEEPEEKYTLDNLNGRIVDLQLRNGQSVKGIVQKPRDFVLDKNALRIIDLKQFRTLMIPKMWVISGKVGDQEIVVNSKKNDSSLARGESKKVKGSNNNVYTVTHKPSGEWTCTCPAYAWKKGDCKHITRVKRGEEQ